MGKKFYFITAAFILIVVLLNLLYRPIPTWADQALDRFKREKDSIGVIIIGHSHTGALQIAEINGLRTLNLSYSGMEAQNEYDIVKWLVSQKSSVKYMLIALDYDQLGHMTTNEFLNNMMMPYKTDDVSLFTKFSNLLAGPQYVRHNRDLQMLFDYYLNGPKSYLDVNVVPVTFTGKDDSVGCDHRATELAVGNTSIENIGKNKKLFSETIKLLKDNNITPVFINTPKPERFNSLYFSKLAPVYISETKKLADSLGVLYLDYSKSRGYSDDDFLDNDHLSKNGCTKIKDSIVTAIRNKH